MNGFSSTKLACAPAERRSCKTWTKPSATFILVHEKPTGFHFSDQGRVAVTSFFKIISQDAAAELKLS